MVAYASPVALADKTDVQIETMRAVAVVLLVSFHVIGSTENSGLQLGYPHSLRLFADFFIDLRMPFFAFIAGYVFAVRPPGLTRYSMFVIGKLSRLYVPFIVAVLSFAILSSVLNTSFALPSAEFFKPLVFGYAHFWFLQAILVIFVVYGLADALLGSRFQVAILGLGVVCYFLPTAFRIDFLSLHQSFYLFPYFMLGVVMYRNAAQIHEFAEELTLFLIVLALACVFWNMHELVETGRFSVERRDVQSLAFGLAMCVLAAFWCPRLPALEFLSPFAFTIYLYHVFGTAAARMAGQAIGISSIEALFCIGLASGLFLPVLLHKTMTRVPRLQRLVLGR